MDRREDALADSSAQLYLDLLKRCLLNLMYEDPAVRIPFGEPVSEAPLGVLVGFDRQKRLSGKDWPSQAHTMIGMRRLDNIQALVEDIVRAQTPGDLIETGVWRGGATIFMRGLLKAYGITDRTVWVADSFAGFPNSDQEGASSRSYSSPELAPLRTGPPSEEVQTIIDHVMQGTSYEEVRDRFMRYGLLDEQVQFLRGWFRNTLPSAPIERFALLRLDGDLHDSTYDALQALYPKLSLGGYAIVDDYGTFVECRQAVHDYFDATNIKADIQPIDDEAVFWQKLG